MKNLMILFFLFLAFSCKEEKKFDPFSYNGSYPRNLDGSEIKIYTPNILGGKIDAYFNGHSWNHAPFLAVYANRFDPPATVTNETEVMISISSMLTATPIEPCLLETFLVRAPLKVGSIDLNDFSKLNPLEYASVKFTSINCDAGKDQYVLDRQRSNKVNILNYDANTNLIKADFDVHFTIQERNSDFGPIYPEHVHLRGTIEATVKGQ